MTQFEYLSVLVSIVIGLGISEVTFAWGQLIRERARVRFSWIHAYWSAMLMFIMVLFWWSFWSMESVDDWSLFGLSVVVLECVTLVLCALVLTPSRALVGEVDLFELYLANARPFFGLIVVFLFESAIVEKLLLDISLLHPQNLVRAVAGVAVAGVAVSRNPTLHRALPWVTMALLPVYLIYSTVMGGDPGT